MRPRVVAIIQARMASSRLPGKVLQDIAGQPMLARVLARTGRASTLDEVLVATTTDASDDAVAAYCLAQKIHCERGSQFDVLDRYYQAARTASAEIVVRVTADCPAIDPQLIDSAVEMLLHGSGGHSAGAAQEDRAFAYDFAANRLPPPFQRTYPIGLDVEVCPFGALQRAWEDGHEAQHREHVMPFLYEGVTLSGVTAELATGVSERGFRVALLNHVPDYGSYRWTVDTPSDLEFMRQVYARFEGQDEFSWMGLLQLVQGDRTLTEINAGVRHKTLKDLDERAAKR